MALAALSPRDRRIIFECLTAAAKGPFFSDGELSTLFGLSRQGLLAVVARIPRLDDTYPEVRRAIGGTLNNLLRYPHGEQPRWGDWVGASPAVVEEVEARWRKLQPPIQCASLKVHGPALIGGTFYRVIGYTVRGGGEGLVSQVWQRGQWLLNSDGPGCHEIMAAPGAEVGELRQAGVDNSTLRPGYDPLRADSDVTE